MNWDAISAIGELIGALAVLITLVYLSLQMRISNEEVQLNRKAAEESNRLARIRVLEQHNTAQSNWRGKISSDPGLSRIFIDAANLAPEEINQVDSIRFRMLSIDLFSIWRVGYDAADAIGDEGQKRLLVENLAGMVSDHRGLRSRWDSGTRHYNEISSPKFAEEIDRRLVESDAQRKDETN